ncbi:MAG TPA: ABC transporter ATP-binding protein [Deltaproteobacteria bacterium]|jgi:cobalt/nickel transport system ATP-binding protein|nr:ABC transporter ATP-binding protein [Deltaproteobacteria bacterium]HRW80810.1 ABC transporter ATP-binding protein [Desulfomonilia bacterium]NMD40356.1 ABC transporter ATP-binding protein [Deltaproteobacteria bacterium]HNQ85573.1 ABC transporter ATP-binding protein [Deltaproteobacteria bacterium]HNS89085.1 ABC transporter ATP-binding protein [Deltaproteobacteria bacterium]
MREVERVIELNDITYAYPGGSTVIDRASLAVSRDERVGIIGPNGSGKTTLFHLVMGLLRPASGAISIFGREMDSEKDFFEARRRIGFLFQNPDDQLFCPTVLEDVAFGPLNLGRPPSQARAIAQETLATLGIADFVHRVSHKLSHGEKKLVALASVLAMGPEVLILDEPTAGLDQDTRGRLVETLDSLGLTLIITSHEMDFLSRMAGVFYTLSDGRIRPARGITPHTHAHVHVGGEYAHRHEDEYP